MRDGRRAAKLLAREGERAEAALAVVDGVQPGSADAEVVQDEQAEEPPGLAGPSCSRHSALVAADPEPEPVLHEDTMPFAKHCLKGGFINGLRDKVIVAEGLEFNPNAVEFCKK